MYKLIQRSGLLFASMIFPLVIGITSAHADEGGYSAASSYICYRKRETNEICYTITIKNDDTGEEETIEICEKEESSSLRCIIIED